MFRREDTSSKQMFPRVTNYGLCACVLVCLLVAPPMFSWIGELMSAPSEVVLDLRGTDILAIYKTAKRNADGSIDLTINVPASADVLSKLLERQDQTKRNLTLQATKQPLLEDSSNGSFPGQHGVDMYRTYYPLTLDTPFLLNSPNLCQDVHPLHVLVVVHTATNNFQRRRLIRETWAGKSLMTSRNLRVLFLLGLSKSVTTQRQIENEHHVYGDLLQGQFKDTYHNLTHKGVMAYRWIHQYCSHAQLILKVDDDIYVNPFLFYDVYFPMMSRMNRTFMCHVRPVNTSPIYRGRGKWMVQDYQFRGYKSYPVKYCNGYLVIITPDIIKAMYSAAYITPFFWVDDVYLYGMLPDKVGNVNYIRIQQNMTLNSEKGLKCFHKPRCSLLASEAKKEPELAEMWRLTLKDIPAALRAQVNPVYLVT